MKIRSASTHDILVYSIKAQKHKEIYPYLRYGLVVGECSVIHNRFFTHNTGFDFALAMSNTDQTNDKTLIRIIRDQISNAKMILSVLEVKHRSKAFNTKINIEREE